MKNKKTNLNATKQNKTKKSPDNKAKEKAIKNENSKNNTLPKVQKKFPEKFPFWARLKIGKKRTTLVIDSEKVVNKKTKKEEDGFVHREATSRDGKGREMIVPNPDKDKEGPMYLKSPRKHPKVLFKPHNKNLDMPEDLKKRYEKNNLK